MCETYPPHMNLWFAVSYVFLDATHAHVGGLLHMSRRRAAALSSTDLGYHTDVNHFFVPVFFCCCAAIGIII